MNMKKNKFLLLIVSVLLILNSCKKDGGNPLSSYDNFKQGAYIYLDKYINYKFDISNLPNSKVGVAVKKYLNGVKIDSVILYASSSSTNDKSKWKLVKAIKFNADSIDLTCTGAELATALGVNVNSFSAGSQYFFYNRIVTSEGLSYDVTNTLGALEPITNAYKACFRWSAYITCPYNADEFFGVGKSSADFIVNADGWEDWAKGDVVTVYRGTKEDPNAANKISLRGIYGENAIFVGDLVVNIDPLNGTGYIPLVAVLKYSSAGTTYSAQGYGFDPTAKFPDPSVRAAETAEAGFIFSCTGYLGLTLNWFSVSGTDLKASNFGTYKLVLQKL